MRKTFISFLIGISLVTPARATDVCMRDNELMGYLIFVNVFSTISLLKRCATAFPSTAPMVRAFEQNFFPNGYKSLLPDLESAQGAFERAFPGRGEGMMKQALSQLLTAQAGRDLTENACRGWFEHIADTNKLGRLYSNHFRDSSRALFPVERPRVRTCN